MADPCDSISALILRAFCEVAEAGGTSNLVSVKSQQSAKVISAPIVNSRTLKETGYLPSQVSTIEIKRTDFNRLRLVDGSIVTLDGETLRVLIINDDASDPILNLSLAPQR